MREASHGYLRRPASLGGLARGFLAALILGFVLLPAVWVLPVSFSASDFIELFPSVPGIRWYQSATSDYWLQVGGLSVLVAVCAGGLATVVALPAAYFARFGPRSPLKRIVIVVALLPLLVPSIALAVGYQRILGESGWLVLAVGHGLLSVPFCFCAQLYGLHMLDDELIPVAALSGATPNQVLVRVAVPAIRPHIAIGAVLAALYSLDESILSLFITNRTTVTLGRAAYETMTRERDLSIAAVDVVLLIITFLLVRPLLSRTLEA